MSTAALLSTSTEIPVASTPQQIALTLTIDSDSNGGLSMSWNPDSVNVTQTTANFTITLQNSTSAVLTQEILWKRGGNHIKQPPAITNVNLNTTTQTLTFTDNNPQGDKTWNFQVWVWYDNKAYLSPDPTIVNKDV